MNKTYRLIWNELTRTWVAVSEITRSRGKRAAGCVAVAADYALALSGLVLKPLVSALAMAGLVHAAPPAPSQLPTGGQVVAGTASIGQSGSVMNISQSGQRAAINWQTFNVGSAAQVNFNQPNASSVTLNRVLDSNPSQIFGSITANGQVFLSNPSGVYFAPGSSVDVGSLVATTHSISDADFMAGKTTFNRDGATGSVINDGNLTARLGGYIALLAPEVRNNGVIVAQLGTVALAAGEAFELQFDGNNTLANLIVTPATIKVLVENGNAVHAPGGLIILSAQAADSLLGGVVTNSGTIEATGITSKGGVIRLDAGNGQTSVYGTLDASSSAGQGGHIEATGEYVLVADGAHLNASGKSGGGEVLVGGSWQNSDPTVRQATAVYVAKSALLEASATDSGNGGTVVAWSDVGNPDSATRAYGSFTAQGGANGGNGGRIETSGHWLDVAGISANAAAAKGAAGVWLLDPTEITVSGCIFCITTGTDTFAGPPYIFSPSGFPSYTSTIKNSDIQNQLNAGTSVTLQTTGTNGDGFGVGTITVSGNIAKTAGTDATLLIKAHSDIVISSGVTISSNFGKLNVVLNADSDATGGGNIWLKSSAGVGATINSYGGNITLSGGTNVATGYAQGNAANGNGVTLDTASLNSAGGNIVIRGKSTAAGFGDGINLTGNNVIDAGSGTIDMQGIGQGNSGYSNGIQTSSGGYNQILSAATSTTAINLAGDASAGTATYGWGTFLWGGTLVAATGAGGGITINGKGSNVANGGGTQLEPNTYALAASGPISITGTKGTSSTYQDVVLDGNIGFASSLPAGFGTGGVSPVTASSSAVTINADTLGINTKVLAPDVLISGNALQSSGALVIQPRSAATSIDLGVAGSGTLQLLSADISNYIASGFSGITVGNASAGNITVAGATSFSANTSLVSGGNIAINTGLTDTGNTITLTGGNGASVSGSGNITASKLLLNGGGTNYVLNSATGNSVGTLAASTGSGNVSFSNNGALVIGTVGSSNGITTTSGTVDVATATGNLTVAQNIASSNTSASAITLNAAKNVAAGSAAGGDLLISGSPTITTGSGGRATLYTGSISGSSGLVTLLGSGSGRFRYNSDETATNYTTAIGSGLYAIYREQPTVTVTAVSDSKTYNGLAYSGGNGVTSSGFVDGDTSAALSGTLAYSGTSQGAKNANTYTITPSGYGNGLGYALTYANGTLTIGKQTVTLSASKTYDGTNSLTGNVTIATGISGESLTYTGATASDANVATANKYISAITLANGAGGAASNYQLPTLSNANAPVTISAKSATLSAAKTYDGTNSLTGNVTIATGISGESLTYTGATASDANVATANKYISAITLADGTGGAASNYLLPTLNNANAPVSIAAKTLTVSGTTAGNKTYDGTTAATLSNGTLVGVVPADAANVTLTQAGTFATQNFGTAITVTAADSLGGSALGNYTLTQPTGLSANIAAKTVTLSAAKTYDGTNSLTGNVTIATGISGESLTYTGATASDANVATANKYISAITLANGTGGAASNYQLPSLNSANAPVSISPASLILSGARTYDGTSIMAGSVLTASGVNSQTFSVTGLGDTSNLSSPNVQTNSMLATVTGLSLGSSSNGGLASNYNALSTAGSSVSISPKVLSIVTVTGSVAANKVYDGTLTATVTGGTMGGLVGSDIGSTNGGNASLVQLVQAGTFASKNVGNAIAVTVNDSLSGTDAGNYTLTQPTGLTANISAKPLTVAGTAVANKTYDATTAATLSNGTLVGVVLADASNVTLTQAGTFATQNVGTGITVSAADSLGGSALGNYTLTEVAQQNRTGR